MSENQSQRSSSGVAENTFDYLFKVRLAILPGCMQPATSLMVLAYLLPTVVSLQPNLCADPASRRQWGWKILLASAIHY